MNRIVKFVAPAALALAAFGAQAEGFTPSAGGVYQGPVAQASAVSTPAVTPSERAQYAPSAGGEFKGMAAKASVPAPAGTDRVSQRQMTFLGA
jgi:hypothetical protein